MKAKALPLLAMEITHLIDMGKYDRITIDEVYAAMRDKRPSRFLKEQAGTVADLNHFLDTNVAYGDFEIEYGEQMANMHNAYSGDHRRKWGIENRGLCLLLAWTIQRSCPFYEIGVFRVNGLW